MVRRRMLLTGLTATAAAAVSAPLLGTGAAAAQDALLGNLLVARLREAILGGTSGPLASSPVTFKAEYTRALADFDACRYASLAVWLPRLIRCGNALIVGGGTGENHQPLSASYLLATRMLIKLDQAGLAWMAADRARQLAHACGDAPTTAESARQLAVLARKAGRYDQALAIALSAVDHPDLRGVGKAGTAARGLLIHSAEVAANSVSPAGRVAIRRLSAGSDVRPPTGRDRRPPRCGADRADSTDDTRGDARGPQDPGTSTSGHKLDKAGASVAVR